ncbi:hypothetical protein CI238_05007, partial [Colletotrichum incanum]
LSKEGEAKSRKLGEDVAESRIRGEGAACSKLMGELRPVSVAVAKLEGLDITAMAEGESASWNSASESSSSSSTMVSIAYSKKPSNDRGGVVGLGRVSAGVMTITGSFPVDSAFPYISASATGSGSDSATCSSASTGTQQYSSQPSSAGSEAAGSPLASGSAGERAEAGSGLASDSGATSWTWMTASSDSAEAEASESVSDRCSEPESVDTRDCRETERLPLPIRLNCRGPLNRCIVGVGGPAKESSIRSLSEVSELAIFGLASKC